MKSKAIPSGSGRAACFTLKVRPARSIRDIFPCRKCSLQREIEVRAGCLSLAPQRTISWGHHRSSILAEEEEARSASRRLTCGLDDSARIVVGLNIEYGSLKLLPDRILESVPYRRPLEYCKSFSPTSTPCSFSYLATSRCSNCAVTPKETVSSLFSSRLSARCSLGHSTIVRRAATRVKCNYGIVLTLRRPILCDPSK